MPGARDAYNELKRRILQRLTADFGDQLNQKNKIAARTMLQERLDVLLAEENIILKRHEKRQLTEDIVAELLGFGPLEPLLDLDGVDQIMVNGPKSIFIKRNGLVERMDVSFEDDAHIMRIIERIVAPLGRNVDQDSPVLDARLSDGSHVNIVVPPVAPKGPTITIHRGPRTFFTAQDLRDANTVTTKAIEFLRACVFARLNIIISGKVGSGKTTLLGTLCSFIPAEERIVTIEDMAELRIDHEHIVSLEAYLTDTSGKKTITTESLVKSASRIGPDRLILGDIQGSEALAWLQATNTGLDGSITTSYAHSPADLLARVEVLAHLAGAMLPQRVIRDLITSSIDLIVHLEQLQDGSRRVISISEISAFRDDQYITSDIFRFEQKGLDEGQVVGALQPTGNRSRSAERIQAAGLGDPATLFGIETMRNNR
jgi:pilus assembly protein CpaF